jgi:hypothetical protein
MLETSPVPLQCPVASRATIPKISRGRIREFAGVLASLLLAAKARPDAQHDPALSEDLDGVGDTFRLIVTTIQHYPALMAIGQAYLAIICHIRTYTLTAAPPI